MRMYNCTGRAVWTGQTGDGKQCTGVLEQLLSLVLEAYGMLLYKVYTNCGVPCVVVRR